jgi:transposase
MMTAAQYKIALNALNLTHRQAAKALGIGYRTSQRYATQGAPLHIALALEALAGKQKEAA